MPCINRRKLTRVRLIPCQSCRSRKKRCYHDTSSSPKGTPAAAPESLSNGDTRESTPSPAGRVSEYNPESVLEELTTQDGESQSNGPEPYIRPHVPVHRALAASQRLKRQLIWYRRQKRRTIAPNLSIHHRRYLADVGALAQLPKATTDALIPMYISTMDDLLPLMDGGKVYRDYSNGLASDYLIRAMCLTVCKYRQAAPFLRLTEDGPLLKPLEFGANLLKGIDAALKADLESDRVTKVQILALLHLHNDGFGGVDRSTNYLSQAITEAWSMSLHWYFPGNSDQRRCDMLWWSLRNFDRLNKPIMGASPFMIDDADIGIDRITALPGDYRSEVMVVSLLLGDLMKTATKLYRATCMATEDDCDSFPSLAEVTAGTGFENFHKAHKSYLEIWYHVAAMLSCRFSGPGSIPYNRRLASADRILQLVSDEHGDLPPLPLVPYAMSMSTTMIYRALGDGQREFSEACDNLKLCCSVLHSLSKNWSGVRGVSKMATRLWKLLSASAMTDKTPSSAAGSWSAQQMSPPLGACSMEMQRRNVPVQQAYDGFSSVTSACTESVATLATPPQSSSSSDPRQYLTQGAQGQCEPVPPWSGFDPSFFQLDTAFNDLFDGGVPNFFRPHTAWEFLHALNGESPQELEAPYPQRVDSYEYDQQGQHCT